FRIHVVNMGKYLRNISIVLSCTVTVTDPSLPVYRIFKAQFSILVRWKFLAEIYVPRLISPVRSDDPVPLEPLQVCIRDLQCDHDLNNGKVFLEVLLTYRVIAAHCAHGIQHSSLSRIILSHKDQGVLYPADVHLPDRFKIP